MTTRRQFLNTSIVASLGCAVAPPTLEAQENILLASKNKFLPTYNILASRPIDGETIKSEQERHNNDFISMNEIDERKVAVIRQVDATLKLLSLGQIAENLPYEQRLEKLKEAKDVFVGKKGVSLERSIFEGLKTTYDLLDDLEREKFLADISDASGKAAKGLALGGLVAGPAAFPALELGAAAAGLVSVMTNQGTDKFYNDVKTEKLAHVTQVWAKQAIRKQFADPAMAEGIATVGNKHQIDLSFLKNDISLDNLPSNLRPAFGYIGRLVLEGKGLSATEQIKLANSLKKQVAEHFDSAFAGYISFQEERRAEVERNEAATKLREKEDLIKEEREAGEIESASYLASFVASQVFKDPKVANGVTQVYKSCSLIAKTVSAWNSKLSDGTRAIGTVALTGNFVQAFSMLASIAFEKKDATQIALENIQKTLNAVRKEMHQRFDEVVKTQLQILDKLAKVEDRLEDIQVALIEIKSIVVINDNEARLRDSEEYKAKLKEAVKVLEAEIKLQRTSGEAEANVLSNAALLFAHAEETSTYSAFTRNDAGRMTDIPRGWDSKYIRNLFRNGTTNLFYLSGYISTIRTYIGQPVERDKPIHNIDVFIESANLFSQVWLGLPQFREKHLDGIAIDFERLGREIELQYKEAFSGKFITALKAKIVETFAAFIKKPLQEALTLMRNVKREGEVSEQAMIYPFSHPICHSIKNGGKVPESIYHNRRISIWQNSDKRVQAGKSYTPAQVIKMQGDRSPQFGERLSFSRMPFNMAINYGLITASIEERTRIVANGEYKRTTYNMTIVSGDYNRTTIPRVRFYEKTSNSEFKDCCLDVKLNSLMLGTKSFANEQIDPHLNASDFKSFERFLYELISIQHNKLRAEYVGELRTAFDEDSPAKANFESLVSSLCYLAGLSLQLAGNEPEECAGFAKIAHECLLADRKSLENAVENLLKPENAPKSKDGKILETVDENIVDYLAKELTKRLVSDLDKFTNEHIHTRDKGVELMQFCQARGRIQSLQKIRP